MTVEKSQLRALMAESFGRDLEQDLEGAQVRVYKLQGAHEAVSQAAKAVSDLSVKVRDELYEGKISFDPEDELAVAKFVVGRVQDAVAKLKELAENAKNQAIKADGERAGLERAVEKLKSVRDTEQNKIAALQAKIAAGEVIIENGEPVSLGGHRAVGAHPGPTLKMARQHESEAPEKKMRKKKTKLPAEAPLPAEDPGAENA